MTISRFALGQPMAYPPRITAFTRPFWDGLRNGIFQSTQCEACHHISFPPKPICPHCWHEKTRWVALPVTGEIYSWTIIHAGPAAFSAELPYAVGVIDLDNDVRLACRLHPTAPNQKWACGMAVTMQAGLADNGVMLVATPR